MLTIDVPHRPRSVAAGLLVAAAVLLGLLPAGASAARPRNGRVAYQAGGSPQGTVLLRQPDGGDPSSVQAAGAAIAGPRFSPLGQRIAYASGGQIWVAQADGTMQRQLTADPLPSGSPAWSPDGGSLVFARGPVGDRDLYTIGTDGNDLHRLTLGGPDDSAPAWSRDGRIAFVRHTPPRSVYRVQRRGRRRVHRRVRIAANDDLMVMAADGAQTVQLTTNRANDRSPAWSPNGRHLAFVRRVGHHDEVFVIDADGRHAHAITHHADASGPTWSPDGRWIAYAGGRSPDRAIFVLHAWGRHRHRHRVTPAAADATAPDWLAQSPDPVIAAAGDIACDPDQAEFGQGLPGQCHQVQTSNLLLKMDLSKVLALGDLQYVNGQYDKIMRSFDPSWGRLKPLIEPAIGNHDYRDPGAAGLYQYFYGDSTSRDEGYYSFDVGTWHVVALDSSCVEDGQAGDCAAGSPQEQWLRADLAAHPAKCTLAFLHHPYMSSGLVEPFAALHPLYQALYDGGVDVVLAGHDHAYERFAPTNPDLQPDAARGLRQFVVGTGGESHQSAVSHVASSVVRNGDTFGVLQMTLHPDSYDWRFVPDLTSGSFTDAGTAECH